MQSPNPFDELKSILIRIEGLVSNNYQDHNSTSPSNKIWLNLDELCNYLPEKPAKATVYAWVSNRLIPFHKKGKPLYFLQSEIDEWLISGRKNTLSEISDEAIRIVKRNRARSKR